ncbi:MAG: TIR domain-containing protein, partial [Streptococcus salivarius]
MSKIFIAHAWSDDENYSQRQLDFIRKLELELEEKNLEVIYDDNTVNKNTLNQFMIENIRNCDVILSICDKAYLEKSEIDDSGVSFEIKEIT